MEQCCFMVLEIVMMVLTSTSHISHKQLIVIFHREASKMSLLFAIKMMMLMMVLTMVLTIVLKM
eukprot:5811202-Ditylum_brightwellii.AAC.1